VDSAISARSPEEGDDLVDQVKDVKQKRAAQPVPLLPDFPPLNSVSKGAQ